MKQLKILLATLLSIALLSFVIIAFGSNYDPDFNPDECEDITEIEEDIPGTIPFDGIWIETTCGDAVLGYTLFFELPEEGNTVHYCLYTGSPYDRCYLVQADGGLVINPF